MLAPQNSDLSYALKHLTASQLGNDVAAFADIWVAVVAVGLALRRLLAGAATEDSLTDAAIALGLGITGYGAVLFAIGFLPVLHKLPLTILTVVAAGLLIWVWRDGIAICRGLVTSLGSAVRREWPVVIPGIGFIVIAFVAGFRPPFASDEIAYHWAAPVLWAHAGHWVTSPYRFTDGFNMAETIYTTAAVFHAPTAAHWTDGVMFVLLGLGTAALCRRFGGIGALAAAAVIALPAAATQSWLAYNDVFGAALVIAACAAIGGRTDSRSRWITGILLAGAISIKPLLIFMAVLPILLAMNAERQRSGVWSIRDQVRSLVRLAVPGVIAAVAWAGYGLIFVDQLFQQTGVAVMRFGHTPTGSAVVTIRIPDFIEVLEIPFLPLATAIIGQREPYGNRSSLVLLVFIPVLIVTLVKMAKADRDHLGRLALPLLITYLVSAILIVRTRFLIVLYAGALAAASITVVWWSKRRPAIYGKVLHWTFRVLTLVGMLDSVHHAFSG